MSPSSRGLGSRTRQRVEKTPSPAQILQGNLQKIARERGKEPNGLTNRFGPMRLVSASNQFETRTSSESCTAVMMLGRVSSAQHLFALSLFRKMFSKFRDEAPGNTSHTRQIPFLAPCARVFSGESECFGRSLCCCPHLDTLPAQIQFQFRGDAYPNGSPVVCCTGRDQLGRRAWGCLLIGNEFSSSTAPATSASGMGHLSCLPSVRWRWSTVVNSFPPPDAVAV